MRFKDYKVLFRLTVLSLAVLIVLPTVGNFVLLPEDPESFSGLWILDSDRRTANYPLDIEVGQNQNLFIGIHNALGYSAYYLIYSKLRNRTQPIPNPSTSQPSTLSPVSEFRFIVKDGETVETELHFSIDEAMTIDNTTLIEVISLNGESSQVDVISALNVNKNGFFFQLIFELWLYNAVNSEFEYHNRFVGVWLNIIT